MTVAALVVAIVAVFIAVGSAGVSARRSTSLASLTKRRAIVTLKSGESFAGVVFDVDREMVLLRNAELLTAGERAVPVDGEVLILRADVAYLQFP